MKFPESPLWGTNRKFPCYFRSKLPVISVSDLFSIRIFDGRVVALDENVLYELHRQRRLPTPPVPSTTSLYSCILKITFCVKKKPNQKEALYNLQITYLARFFSFFSVLANLYT